MDTRRFNNPEYKRQISRVRHYRRSVSPYPETAAGKVLSILGLGSVFRKLCAAVALAAAVYLVYFAGFLQVKSADVQGADPEQTREIASELSKYEKTFAFIFPQRNFLFFSGSGFAKYLLGHDLSIFSVNYAKRRFWGKLEISVVQKVSAFVLQSDGNYYLLNSDGSLGNELAQGSVQILQFPLVIDTGAEAAEPGEKFLQPDEYGFLSYINANIAKDLQIPLDHFEIAGAGAPQLTAYLKSGARIYFNSTADPRKYLGRLLALWNNLSADQQKNLAYFDLRFSPDAYGCFQGSPCAAQTAPQLPAAPSVVPAQP